MGHDNDDWPKADNDTTIVLVVATVGIIVIAGAYAYARHLIGVSL